MPGLVLTQKVRRPAAEGLRRPRLIEPLLAHGARRVGLVMAPAGCGKTTLLAHVASTAAGPVGWYRAGADDSTEHALVRHLSVALREATGAGADPSVTAIDQLLHRLDEWSGDSATLIVDDLHELAGTPAERALGRLLELGPPRLRLLLGSRRRPAVNLSRLQVAGGLHQLDGDDLRFRSWEVEQLFEHVYGEPLSPESSAALSRRTQGWAAGLQMFHLATAGGTTAHRRAAVEALSGRSRLIRSYLVDNVLSGLSAGRRSFLVRTCTLGLLTGEMCDELLGTTGSHAVLRQLEEDQVFTASDEGGTTFRYHQVLQDHLEVLLHEDLGREEADRLYRRSAQVLERRGHVREALRAFARAEDWASAEQLLGRAGARMADHGQQGWEALLPADLREKDPWLTLAAGRDRLRRGAVAAAVDLLRHAETLLGDPGFEQQCRRERMVASAWLPEDRHLLRPVEPVGAALHWTERLRADTVRLRYRQPVDPAGPRREGSTGPSTAGDRLELGLAHLLAGRALDAEQELATVCDQADPHSLEQVAAMTARALLMSLTGRPATAQLEAAALAADLTGRPWLERLSRVVLRARPAGAGEGIRSTAWDGVVQECRDDGDEWGAALVQLLRGAFGVLSPAHHDPAVLDDGGCLDDAAACFHRMRAPVLAAWAEAVRVLGLARRGAPGLHAAALRVDGTARMLGMPGAQALTRFSLALLDDASRHRRRLLAAELCQECGVPVTDAVIRSPTLAATRSPVAPEVRLRVLGGFALTVGGRDVSWAGVRPRALTLLRMLAVSAAVDVHRERLVDALWPDADLAAGTRRLQVAVSSVRHALDTAGLPGRDLVRRHGDAYRLTLPPGARVDVEELRRALSERSAARLRGERAAAMDAAQRALVLHCGELLPEDGPAEWVVHERDRLRVLVAVAARELADDCCAVGDAAGAVVAARRSLELDPCQDSSWELLARAHEQMGDASAAARARSEGARVAAELLVPGAGAPGRWGLAASTRPR